MMSAIQEEKGATRDPGGRGERRETSKGDRMESGQRTGKAS